MKRLSILKRLLGFALQYKWWLLLASLTGFLTVGSGIGLLMTSAYIIAKTALQPSIADISVAIVGVRFFGISRGLFRYLDRLISHEMTFRLLAKIRVWFYQSLEPLVPSTSIRYKSGDLLSRMVADVNSLEGFYVRVLAPPVVTLLVSLLMWILLGLFSWKFSLVLLFGFVIGGILVPFVVQNRAKQLSTDIIHLRSRLSETTIDIVQGLPELKMFNQTEFFLNEFDHLNSQLVEKQFRLKKLLSSQQSVITFVMNVTLFDMLLIAIPQVTDSILDGVFLSVIVLGTMAAFEAIQPLPAAAQDLQSSLQAAERLFDFVGQNPEPQNKVESRKDVAVQFENVSFRYDETNVLKNVSFEIKKGEKIAFVGPSGSGKSTLINLMLGFWQPQQGSVLIVSQKKIAVMSQNSYLFNNTIRENLLLANSDATEKHIKDTLDKAVLSELIKNLPDGLDTWLGEHGHTISGGEKQRLSIARTLLQNSHIQIYDEPTAHLDAETEKKIISNILDQPDRTIILLTHRFIGLDKIDKIYVLQKGEIVESGTFLDLIKSSGLFADMLKIQNDYLL